MTIKLLRPMKITEVGPDILPADHVCEVSKDAGQIFVKAKCAVEVKAKDLKVTDAKTVESDKK